MAASTTTADGQMHVFNVGGFTFGMGANGQASFEFGGAYDPGGKPFSISVVNVT